MPLISPETSSPSSKDGDVLIMSSSGTIYLHTSTGDTSEPLESSPALWPEPTSKDRDRIIILGPFPPRTIDLTSSDSDISLPALSDHYDPRYSPIAVPIPSYEDCFQDYPCHSDIFDPVEYEASVIAVEVDSDGTEAFSDGPLAPTSGERLGGQCEHLETVQYRLEAQDALMSLECPTTPKRQPAGFHSDLDDSPAVGPKTSPSIDETHDPICNDVFREDRPKPRSKLNPNAPAYTIPQLRSLAITDDLPVVENNTICHACHDRASSITMKRLMPCHDIICRRCFSAALGAVSEGHPVSRCPACLRPMTAFAKVDYRTKQHLCDNAPGNITTSNAVSVSSNGPIIMRIDNVAWDLTPHVVEAFLPPNTLADIPVPIHIPLDRYDGRTKDYMYIEVASSKAAHAILQQCQNAHMPGGPLSPGRKRAVTITQVHHSELLRELRPHSASELRALLALCQASISDVQPPTENGFIAPNGVAHFVKNRHGPFNALMSILSRVKGKDSPVYWDLFYITSGAIAALASHIARMIDPAVQAQEVDVDPDRAMLKKLTGMFEDVFSIRLRKEQLSPR